MAKGIQFKRSSVPQTQPLPSELSPGEIAINLADKKIYTLNDNSEVINIGFDFDEYINNQFVSITGSPLSGLLSFDTSKYSGGATQLEIDVEGGSEYNLVHKGYIDRKDNIVNEHIIKRVPVGSVVVYPYMSGDNPIPAGWLHCNGSLIPNGAEYDALRDKIGTNTPTIADLTTGYVYIIRYLEDQASGL